MEVKSNMNALIPRVSQGILDDITIMQRAMFVNDIVDQKCGRKFSVIYTGNFPLIKMVIRFNITNEKAKKKFFEVRHITAQALSSVFNAPTDGFHSSINRDGFLVYKCKLLDSKGNVLPFVEVVMYTYATCYDSLTKKFLRCYETEKGCKGKGECPCGNGLPHQTADNDELTKYFG